MVNQCTKFEVSRFTRYEAMNGGPKCKKWGGLGQLGVTQGQRQCHHLIDSVGSFVISCIFGKSINLFDFERRYQKFKKIGCHFLFIFYGSEIQDGGQNSRRLAIIQYLR